jgi:hypothetical protein
MTRLRMALATLLVAASTFALAGPATAQVPPIPRIDVPGQATAIYGVRNTLPPLSAPTTYAAGPGMAAQIQAFRASGAYQREQRVVAFYASRFQAQWIRRHCPGAKGHAADRCPDGRRPAAVFDIDDTLVSWYALYASTGFTYTTAIAEQAIDGCATPRIAPVVQFYRDTISRGVTPFLITGRNDSDRAATESCLARLGIRGYHELVMRTNAQESLTATAYKSAARNDIEAAGYRIITSIGDQVSDSAGGYTRRGYLLPNPMYFIP